MKHNTTAKDRNPSAAGEDAAARRIGDKLRALGWKQWERSIDLSGTGKPGEWSIGCWYWSDTATVLMLEGLQ
jgi:hypothetical protein